MDGTRPTQVCNHEKVSFCTELPSMTVDWVLKRKTNCNWFINNLESGHSNLCVSSNTTMRSPLLPVLHYRGN